MIKNKSLRAIIDNLALLIIAALVGTIVSFVAQLFIISAKNIYEYIFYNQSFTITIDIGYLSLNVIPLLICVPSSILVGLLMYFLKLPRWFGPADTIYAAHHRAGVLNLKGGFGSTLASFRCLETKMAVRYISKSTSRRVQKRLQTFKNVPKHAQTSKSIKIS